MVEIEVGVVSGEFEKESPGVGASGRRPHHEESFYHEERVVSSGEGWTGGVRTPFDQRNTKLDDFTDRRLLIPPKCQYCDYAGLRGVN